MNTVKCHILFTWRSSLCEPRAFCRFGRSWNWQTTFKCACYNAWRG